MRTQRNVIGEWAVLGDDGRFLFGRELPAHIIRQRSILHKAEHGDGDDKCGKAHEQANGDEARTLRRVFCGRIVTLHPQNLHRLFLDPPCDAHRKRSEHEREHAASTLADAPYSSAPVVRGEPAVTIKSEPTTGKKRLVSSML